jgi:flagellar motility protein MotE (MotC chaperone)
VPLDYATLDTLRRSHPAWRLLDSPHAPLAASFLHQAFVAPNVRVMAQADLVEKLEDALFGLRLSLGEGVFPRSAGQYLDDWAANDKGWLRKFYPPGSDEAHFDLTPATEKALAWLESLTQRAFVGTESRLMTVFELLRQMVEGSETDPEARIRELEKRRAEIDAEIERVRAGDMPLLDDTAVKDRFQQVAATARELLSDFREVEQNFRNLDRSVRERITLWDGGKGALLESIFGERDAIADSDQGKSFRAFWDFLMSPARQEELSSLLESAFGLSAVQALAPDGRLKRVHYDWLEAGEHTQRTVALLSMQLRRFLDDQAWLENRRIMEVLHGIETQAVAVREAPPTGGFMELDEAAPGIELPMERPLYTPPIRPVISEQILLDGGEDVETDALFGQVVVDKTRLAGWIRQSLQEKSQITLGELVQQHPLEHGLAELVAWLTLASEDRKTVFEEDTRESVAWLDSTGKQRRATLPRVSFVR